MCIYLSIYLHAISIYTHIYMYLYLLTRANISSCSISSLQLEEKLKLTFLINIVCNLAPQITFAVNIQPIIKSSNAFSYLCAKFSRVVEWKNEKKWCALQKFSLRCLFGLWQFLWAWDGTSLLLTLPNSRWVKSNFCYPCFHGYAVIPPPHICHSHPPPHHWVIFLLYVLHHPHIFPCHF